MWNSDPVSLGSIKGQARKTRQPKTFTKRELSALRQTFQELAPCKAKIRQVSLSHCLMLMLKEKKKHTVLKHTSGAHIQDNVGKQHTVDSLEFVTRTEVKGIGYLLAQQ